MKRAKTRHCRYCPEPNANVCIRSHRTETGDTVHVYAHAACAAERNITPLYSFIEPSTRAGEPT